jgi:sporulation protein YlmC with PRC-barrel domain
LLKIQKTALVALSLLVAPGCVHNRDESDRQGGGTSPGIAGTTTVQATAPPIAHQALSGGERADKLMGEEVLTSDHQRTGRINDFVVDQDSGQILYAIVGIGGVLGVGETRIAAPPGVFTQAKQGDVQLNVDKHKLTQAPHLTEDFSKDINVDFLNNIYGYFGQTGWTGSTPAALSKAARKVSDLIGLNVVNSGRQEIGKVQTVFLNVPKGREDFVVLSPTVDLKLGNNYYALPFQALKFSPDQKTLVADLTKEKLSNGPRFAKDDWSELSDPGWAQKVYQYYGQPPTSETETLQPTGRTQTSPANQNH